MANDFTTTATTTSTSDAPAWTYSDWITYARGSSTRLTRLRLHMQEVTDYLQNGPKYQQGDIQMDKSTLISYLAALSKTEDQEEKLVAIQSGTRCSFTKGRFRQ